jgi:hypothetical protein
MLRPRHSLFALIYSLYNPHNWCSQSQHTQSLLDTEDWNFSMSSLRSVSKAPIQSGLLDLPLVLVRTIFELVRY